LWLLHHHSGGDSLLRFFLNYCLKFSSGISSTATFFAFDEKEPNETTTASHAEEGTKDTSSGTTSATSLRDAHLRIVGWDSLVVVDCSICDIVEETFNLERSQAGLGLSNSGSSR